MNKLFFIPLAALLLLPPPAPAAPLPPDLAAQAHAAMARGAEWLAARQQPDGVFGSPEAPAVSALALWALHTADPDRYAPAVSAATDFVLSNAQPDGGIWKRPAPGVRGGGLANYNTAVCLQALHSLHRPDLVPLLLKTRQFLANAQYISGELRGGIGYTPDQPRPYADLSNSAMVYDAMRATQDLEDLRAAADPKVDLDWQAAQEFLAQVQNLPSVNKNPWCSLDEDDRGGFIYTPAAGPARPPKPAPDGAPGAQPPSLSPRPAPASDVAAPRPQKTSDLAKGEFLPPPRGGGDPTPQRGVGEEESVARPAPPAPVTLRSYGSMTYAGLLSLVYANVAKDDPRVVSAMDWATRHWSLDENPGQGQEGLFYFFMILTKCLDVYGDDLVTLPDGTQIPWRQEVIQKLLSLQSPEGSWVNATNRFWEADPVLVTSYALLTLSRALP